MLTTDNVFKQESRRLIKYSIKVLLKVKTKIDQGWEAVKVAIKARVTVAIVETLLDR